MWPRTRPPARSAPAAGGRATGDPWLRRNTCRRLRHQPDAAPRHGGRAGPPACAEPENRPRKINKTRRRSTYRLLADSGLIRPDVSPSRGSQVKPGGALVHSPLVTANCKVGPDTALDLKFNWLSVGIVLGFP